MKNTWGLIHILAILSLFVGCMEETSRSGRPAIADFTINPGISTEVAPDICEDYYHVTEDKCYQFTCPSKTRVANDSEKSSTITQIENDRLVNDQSFGQGFTDQILDNINTAEFLCIDGSGIIRPNNQVSIEKACVCKDGKSVIVANCDVRCAQEGSTGGKDRLFVDVSVGEDIRLNSSLGNFYRWCVQDIPGSDYTSPSCSVRVSDGNGTQTDLPLQPQDLFVDANKFALDVSTLPYNQPFLFRVVETGSGSNVQSNQSQFQKVNKDVQVNQGPLKIMPISLYSCLNVLAQIVDTDNIKYNSIARTHYLFPVNNEPLPIEPEVTSGNANQIYYCHDIQQHGIYDSPLYDRLELIPKHFALWDLSDSRFVTDASGEMGIHTEITRRLLEEHNVNYTNKVFFPFEAPKRPNTASSMMGYFMNPWIDSDTKQGFCPGEEHYNGSDPVFKVLKEVIGVPTEGIYFALKESDVFTAPDGSIVSSPTDFTFIRENLLKKIWFYKENGQLLQPNAQIAAQRTLHFFWPADVNDPYVKKDYQRTFTVRNPSDVFGQEGSESGHGIKPADKRIGCVPAVD